VGRRVQEGSLGEWEWEANARREAAKRMADLQAEEEVMQQAVSGSGGQVQEGSLGEWEWEASAGRELVLAKQW